MLGSSPSQLFQPIYRITQGCDGRNTASRPESFLNRTLELIREELELEGYNPESPEFDRIFLARKVLKCQEMQHVKDCASCRAFIDCDLARQHMMNVKFGG
jgi:hypothetical protein